MSTKGSEPRTLNRDASKYRKNIDAIDWSGPSSGRKVPKDKLKPGVKFTMTYGPKK